MQLSEYILLAPLRRCIQEWSGILYLFFIIQIISRREGSHFYIYDDAIIYSSTASYFGAEIILKTTNRCTSMVGRTLLRLFVVVEQFYDRPEYV
jgi:hypothetical protein